MQTWFANIRNVVWTTSAAISTGAAAIITMNGANAGRGNAMALGMFMLLGTSEMTDYPAPSTVRSQTEPIIMSAGQVTRDTIANAAEVASDGEKSGVRYMGLLICGVIACGLTA